MIQCLKCGSPAVARGRVAESGGGGSAIFRPEGLRHLTLTLTGGVSLAKEAWACLDCGLVWTTLAPAKLEKFLRRHCHSVPARRVPEAPPRIRTLNSIVKTNKLKPRPPIALQRHPPIPPGNTTTSSQCSEPSYPDAAGGKSP